MKTITDVLTHVSKRAGKAVAGLSGAAIALLLLILLVGLLLIMGGLHAGPPVARADGDPPAGSVKDVVSYELLPQQTLSATDTTTIYSDSPKTVGNSNVDVSKVKAYNEVDVFFDLGVGSGAAFTGTVQFSPDGDTWADAEYTYVGTEISYNVATSTTTETPGAYTQPYRKVFGADGTGVLRVPVAGERIRIEGVYTGAVTPTVWITLRNN